LLALTALFKRVAAVLAGCFFGFLVADALSAYLGVVLYYLIDQKFIGFASAALFFALALFTATQKAEGKPTVKESGVFAPVLTSMFTIMLLEIGDKTQLTTVLLSARFGDALSVIIGVLAAFMLISSITVYVGSRVVERLSLRIVKWLTTLAYALGGGILLFEGVTES